MTLGSTEEQKLLSESAARFADRYSQLHGRGVTKRGDTSVPNYLWREMAELGWLGIGVTPELGGFGGGAIETMILMEAFGRRLVRSPFLSSAVIGSRLVSALADENQKSLLRCMISGERIVALAASEPNDRTFLTTVTTIAVSQERDFVLSGRKNVVLDGTVADFFIVLARSHGSPNEMEGLSLFLVPSEIDGLEVKSYQTYDGRSAANIELNAVRVGPESLLGPLNEAYPHVEQVVDFAIAALCAEAVGAMTSAYELTLDYVRMRRQFGKSIGSFQVIQHRMVDLFVAIEESRSLTLAANLYLGEEANIRRRMVSAAKVQIARAGKLVGEECVQMHGAIGMSDDCIIGDYFKSLLAINALFGDAEQHLGRLSSLPLS